jgi:LPS export ABC transporter permease LptG/LPS export ABC transporter permease LptF
MTKTRLNRLFYREIAGPCLITLLVLTFVVFTREFGRLAEMLIRSNADSLVLGQIVLSILPSVLVFSIPFAFLIGTLIALSRLSSDSEVIAMRAAGISTWQMLQPVLKVGVLVALLTAAFTFLLLPQCNWRLRLLSHDLGFRPIQSEIKPRIFNEDLPDTILYVEDMDLRDSSWRGVFIHTIDDGTRRTILADQGRMISSDDGRRLQLHLEEGSVYETRESSPERDSLTLFETQDLLLSTPETEPVFNKPKRPKDKNLKELWADLPLGDEQERRANAVELHGRLSLPLAALVFAVLGVTLGTSSPRGGRGYGFIVSVTIAFSYFVLFDMGRSLATGGVIPVWLGAWGANLLLSLMATASLIAASRDRTVLQPLFDNRVALLIARTMARRALHLGDIFKGVLRNAGRRFWNFCTLCVQITRVIDLYMVRNFLFYLVPTLLVCVLLFYMFTFFELMDDVFAHDIGYGTVFDYFFYLAPSVLILLLPVSILIATLVTFGVMDKTNQVVAFKSCGVSVYRLAVPVILLSAIAGAGLFVIQEYVAPYANQRQDSLRNVIKGRPAQTFYQLGRNWIFGEGNRLYNYKHFDSENEIFAELSVYELDTTKNRLIRHIYANRARWDPVNQGWNLNQGWQRDFEAAGPSFARFDNSRFAFPERPSYFQQEVKASSKMTFGELRDYVRSLQRAGFEVDHLRTELYKKLSFPVVSLVMSIIGIPFAFSMGRKGALYGVAVGVVIGIVYWGMFGAFEVLGANGLLAPLLAAWGPNLLFSAAGLFMLSTVRT